MIRLKNLLLFNLYWIISIIFIIIYVVFCTKIIKYNSKYDINDNSIIGKIINYKIDGNKISIDVKGKEKIKVNYYISDYNELVLLKNNICLGCSTKLIGSFSKATNNTIPNTFNYKKYLYNRKIYLIFNASKINISKDNGVFYRIKDRIYKLIDSKKNSEYLKIFILGDKSSIDNDALNMYQKNGIAHLFAVSGMHIALLLKIFDLLLSKNKTIKKTIFVSIFLLFYAFLVSFSASIMRAIFLNILLDIKKIFNMKISNTKLLLFLAMIFIIINPFLIYDIGFLYSFIITFSLLYNNKYLKGNLLKQIFMISIISFIFSLPITVNINYEINLISIIANIIIVPLITFIIYPLSLISLVIPFLSSILTYFIHVLEKLNIIFKNFSLLITIPKMDILLIVIYYFFLLIDIKFKKKTILVVIIIILNILFSRLDSSYKVYYLDVKQGDSSLIINPYNSYITLIDTGGKVEYKSDEWKKSKNNNYFTDNTILFMKSMGINKINSLILTHGDFDHMGEAISLVNNFKVEKVIFNCGEFNDLEKELIKVLDKKHIKYYSCIKELNVDDNKLYFLQTKEYDNENDNSNVIYTEIDGYKFIFMGDAGVEKENDILEKYNLSNINVLKVGHHGSKTSSSKEFINEVNPKYSIISVGKNNRYGHPNKEVLNTLENSKIYRTDIDGSIMFKIKNNKLKIETCSP